VHPRYLLEILYCTAVSVRFVVISAFQAFCTKIENVNSVTASIVSIYENDGFLSKRAFGLLLTSRKHNSFSVTAIGIALSHRATWWRNLVAYEKHLLIRGRPALPQHKWGVVSKSCENIKLWLSRPKSIKSCFKLVEIGSLTSPGEGLGNHGSMARQRPCYGTRGITLRTH